MLSSLLRIRDRIEQIWLKRWYVAPRMKATRLDLRLDASTASQQVRAVADLAFRPQTASRTMVCLIGNARVHAATSDGAAVKARVNAPFLVLRFPKKLGAFVETRVQLRYAYRPDEHGTLLQPTTREDCPERVAVTCRRPLLAIVQGRLVKGTEDPPHRTYEWEPPRGRKLNCIVADVRSFKKEMGEGRSLWLHCHADAVARAPRILDVLVQLVREAEESHHRALPYRDFHFVEADDRHLKPFDALGMLVVPRGTFLAEDKATLYGVVAPELNKEWRRDRTFLVARGQAD